MVKSIRNTKIPRLPIPDNLDGRINGKTDSITPYLALQTASEMHATHSYPFTFTILQVTLFIITHDNLV